ncbi:MAG: hypothetical protein ACI9QL_004100 [Candidatus Omnitrophota bacterium]
MLSTQMRPNRAAMNQAGDKIDWDGLRRIREQFLDAKGPEGAYWSSLRLMESYDRTFAERIGWKWDAVFQELKLRGWKPRPGPVTDWGCGTGMAARKFLEHAGTDGVDTLVLWDRVENAAKYATRRVSRFFPGVKTRIARQAPRKEPGVLLISHVLNELDDEQLDELIQLASKAESVIWVEPGTFDASRKLIDIRETLREHLQLVAPCTHQAACGMLAKGNEPHWCHHFTQPPSRIHQDPHWSRFVSEMNIDLGTLPYSFLAFDKVGLPPLENGVRVIGHPRQYKGHCRLLSCRASGVGELSLSATPDKQIFKEVKKERLFPLFQIEAEKERITKITPVT